MVPLKTSLGNKKTAHTILSVAKYRIPVVKHFPPPLDSPFIAPYEVWPFPKLKKKKNALIEWFTFSIGRNCKNKIDQSAGG